MKFTLETSDIERLFGKSDDEQAALTNNIKDKDLFFYILTKAHGLLVKHGENPSLEVLKELEEVLKYQLATFSTRVKLAITDYLDHNEESYLEALFKGSQYDLRDVIDAKGVHNNHFIEACKETGERAKGRVNVANTVYAFFNHSRVVDVYEHYFNLGWDIQDSDSLQDLSLMDQIEFKLALWAMLAMLILACAEDESAIMEANFCIGVAEGLSDAAQAISNGGGGVVKPNQRYYSEMGKKGGNARHAKHNQVKDFTASLISERKQSGTFKNANYDSKAISTDVLEYSNKIGAGLSSYNINDTIKKWIYAINKENKPS